MLDFICKGTAELKGLGREAKYSKRKYMFRPVIKPATLGLLDGHLVRLYTFARPWSTRLIEKQQFLTGYDYFLPTKFRQNPTTGSW